MGAASAVVVTLCFRVHYNVAFESVFDTTEGMVRPAVIVFDPDKIIWPFKVKDLLPPLFIKNENVITDRTYKQLKLYRQAPSLLKELHGLGHQLALVSQTADNETVCQLLDFFGIDQYIKYKEIYLGNITDHMEAIHVKSDKDYGDMLYLVDEFRDIEEMADLGMVCILVGDKGATIKDVNKGFHIFSTEMPDESYSEDSHESSYVSKQ